MAAAGEGVAAVLARGRNSSLSWLIVDAAFSVLSQRIGVLELSRHDGSIAQVCLMLTAATLLTGLVLPWVLAPSALPSQGQATM